MAHIRPTPQVRKHTKTFNGCWTCRARRVRCDETKPECTQCRRKGGKCEGYGIRLQWVNDEPNDNAISHLFAHRSNITPDERRVVFSSRHLDRILNILDSFSMNDTVSNSEKESHFIDCFGVFGIPYPESHSPPESIVSEGGPAVSSVHSDATSFAPSETPQHVSTSLIGGLSEDFWGLPSRLLLSPPFLSDEEPYRLGSTSGGEVRLTSTCGADNNSLFDIGDERNELLAPLMRRLATNPSSIQPFSSHLSNDENFLMYHYSQRVLFLFCVVDHEKSPWKTIHLPKALQAIGDLSVQGSTSKIREALINTLLAISSFLLANDNQLQLQAPDAHHWRSTADKYRCKAIKLLRSAVECDFYTKSPPKYKEFLATTLSMVTMDVVSGDTNTCGIHLDGVYRLIRQGQRWKDTFSPKAQSLHRIYFYLRTIYESTNFRQERGNLSSIEGAMRPCQNGTSASPDIFCRDLVDAQMIGHKPGINLDFEARISSSERIYGIPHGLLVLLAEVIDLADKLNIAQSEGSNSQSLGPVIEQCEQLEKSIMDWPMLVGLEDCTKENDSVNAKIVQQHTLAFHNALIIYFAQNIRQVGHRFLLPYVKSVLRSMERIESLKTGGTAALAAPLYWPAFIAASETFDPSLQDEFRRWYDHLRIYRLGSIRTGLGVLEQIWEAGPFNTTQPGCRWRGILEKTGTRLMLS